MKNYRVTLLLVGLTLLLGGCGLIGQLLDDPCAGDRCTQIVPPPYTGDWVAADENGDFARVNITANPGGLQVEVFERCAMGACTWGAPDAVGIHSIWLPQPGGGQRNAQGVLLYWNERSVRQGLVQTADDEALFSSVPMGATKPFDPGTEADWQRMVRAP